MLAGIGALLLGFATVPVASAQPPASVFVDDLTWTELRDAIQAGKTTVILPVGGTEQSGPLMALGKHNARVRVLAERIATSLGNALVAPVMAYVPEGSVEPPTQHMRFTGTITTPDAAFETVVEYAARSFRLHGFRDIVLLGDHGGYQKDLARVAAKLDAEWKRDPARVHAMPGYYQAAAVGFSRLLAGRGYAEAEIGTHAGLNDTSLTLALAPGLVRAEHLGSGPKPTVGEGVHGDASRASAELGQLGVDLIVATTVEAIKTAAAAH